ncbi:MAG TPA: L-threonylcarbamoyladenylate synthase [Planctomycetota bacterium]|jgi:tRNA threonylcarbamoyl adenosine modification protein (Sua5/YciO/YrdC/YwlC family)
MRTEYLTLDGGPGDAAKITHAATLLKSGALVAFPTETVYGLGADPRNPAAMERLNAVKGREENKPYSLLVPSLKQAESVAGGFPRIAHKLARMYWPGPLTLVVPRRSGGTIGLRLPEHPVTRALLAQCGFPLATPSANRSRGAEPITAKQVKDALDGDIALILDAGPARQGRPSAVVRIENDLLEVKRPGIIPNAELLEVARPTLLFVCTGNTCRSPMAAGFCQLELAEAHKGESLPYRILSAGTAARPGAMPDKMAVAVMRETGVDISRHRGRCLTPGLIDTADWVFTMTAGHRSSILALMPSSTDRVQMLSTRNEDIPDPVSSTLELYRRVRDRIASCLRDVVRLVGGS